MKLDTLDERAAYDELLRCCGSTKWAQAMVARRPFGDEASLTSAADELWRSLDRAAWLEAFAAHPRIGSQRDVAKQSGPSRAWAEGEQAGARDAAASTLDALAEANRAYEAKFGYIYIVCATGKSAEEMLDLCRARLAHAPEDELPVAAEEQRKITALRLKKLLQQEGTKTP